MAGSAPVFFVSVRTPTASYEERVDQSSRVISMTFEDTEAKADKLTLSVDNYDLSQFDSPLWQAGNIIVFSFGYPGAMSPQREMKIQTVKGFNPLQVEALGDEVIFNRKPRTDRKWEKTKRSDVVRKIAEEYGYTGAQLHIEDTNVLVDQVTQGGLTDLQLIRSLANRDGFEFFIDFDGLHFRKRNLGQRPMKELTYFNDRQRGDIISVQVEDNRAPGKPGGIVMKGRDPDTKTDFEVKGTDATTSDRTRLAPERTIYGSSILEAIDGATGQTSEVAAPAGGASSAPAKGVAQDLTIPTSETTKAAAEQSAKGLAAQQQLRAITLTMVCWGDAQLLAKSTVSVKGLGARLSGNYYVISVNHAVNAYTMTVKARRDGHSSAVGAGAFKSNTMPTDAKTNDKAALPAAEGASSSVGEVEVINGQTGETTVKQQFTGGRES